MSRLLSEGLKASAHPGIVYRPGPSGRRAGLAGGPDLSEVVTAIRHASGRGDEKIERGAEQLGLPVSQVRLALSFAAAFPDEVEARIAANEAAAEQVRRRAEQHRRLLGA